MVDGPLGGGVRGTVAAAVRRGHRGGKDARWPADDPALDAPDFLCGAAGTGHVFLRLLGLESGQHVPMALL